MTDLDKLVDLRRRLMKHMESEVGWDKIQAELAALLELDAKATAAELIPELVESFGLWGREEMTGEGGQEPLAAVVFEWSSDQYEQSDRQGCDALGYGFGRCVEREGSVYISRPEYDLGESRFDDCGGIDIGAIAQLAPEWTEENEGQSTYFKDLLSFHVAEVVHHAMATASKSESFAALNKRDELKVLVCPHDRFAVLSYSWAR